MSNAIAVISGTIQEAKNSFAAALTDRSLNFEREAGFAVQILSSKDYTMKVAMDNRRSVIDAVTNIAAIGISLNPARKQAYLIPRDGKICLEISYIGLLDLAIASGSIMWGQSELAYQNDAFRLNGFDKLPTHEYEPFSKTRGDAIGAYVVVKTRDGDYLTTCMQTDEINAIRDRSEGWKAYAAKKIKRTPWSSDWGEMAKKTVIKRASKLWPKTDRLDQAIHYLNTDGGEGLEFNSVAATPQITAVDVVPMIAAALTTKTDAEALDYWREHNKKLVKQPHDHTNLKNAIANHRQAMIDAEAARTVDVPVEKPVAEVDEFVKAMDAAEDDYVPS